jgi:hypothetical protein
MIDQIISLLIALGVLVFTTFLIIFVGKQKLKNDEGKD